MDPSSASSPPPPPPSNPNVLLTSEPAMPDLRVLSLPEDGSAVMRGDTAELAKDFANYFCSYGYLYHQKQMLTDHQRMSAYHTAVMSNAALFEGKVVLDVGTGSGILAIWAAQAGAKAVYAIERCRE